MDGLAVREREGKKVILPIWHEIDESGIKQYSVTLADKFAPKTSQGIDHVVEEIKKEVKPKSL